MPHLRSTLVALVAIIILAIVPTTASAGGAGNCTEQCQAESAIVAPHGFYRDYLREFKLVRQLCAEEAQQVVSGGSAYDSEYVRRYNRLRWAVNKRMSRKNLGPSPGYYAWTSTLFQLDTGELIGTGCSVG